MASPKRISRRKFVRSGLVGAVLTPLAVIGVQSGQAAEAPLLSKDDPAARKVKYTENAAQAKEAGGNTCATCALYQGTYGSAQGPCQIVPGKQVKAAGWCSSWSPQM